MYLRTLKAAHSAKKFWEEIFMPKSQLGGILYIFPPGFKHPKCHINGHISIQVFSKLSVTKRLIISAKINIFPSFFLQLLGD